MPNSFLIDQISGQIAAKRALTISLAGGHNLLFMGPPGAGKTLLAHAASELLPDLRNTEQLEILALRSLSNQSPVQAPHHTATVYLHLCQS